MKKTLLFALLTLMLPIVANAYDFSVDGIYYNINDDGISISVASNGNNSYYGSVVIPSSVSYNGKQYSVTSIGEYAFDNCSSLTSITIPESVTSIGDWAFYNCSGLISVTIPNSVTSIGESVLYNTAWYNNQPDGLIYAGKVAYDYKGTMPEGTEIELEEGTLGIAGGAFWNCKDLTSITIPESVTSIGTSAFFNCSGLTKAEFASIESLCKIEFGNSNANPLFYAKHLYINGQEITDLVIPESVTSIGDYAFYGCTGLAFVTIPNSVTSIGASAFYNCTNLTFVAIPNSVTSIGASAFYNCSNLIYVAIPNSVTSIGASAFYNCSGLTSVTIPNSVTSIGASAFYNCSGLTSVTIPESVTSIGIEAFRKCTGLTSITFPNSVTSIGYNAFYQTAWYDNQPDGLIYVGKVAYKYKGTMPEGTEIVIKDGTSEISGYAFSGCSGLTSITIPNSVTSIGSSAFNRCSGLTSITIPNSVTSIGKSAFDYCSGLKEVYCMARQVPSTNSNAFNNTNIASATLYVPRSAFENYKSTSPWSGFGTIFSLLVYDFEADGICYYINSDGTSVSLTCNKTIYSGSISIPSTVTYNGKEYSVTGICSSAFDGCSGLTSITIPHSVTSIGEYAFRGCSGLTSVTIPSSVTSIGGSAFTECSLQTIVNHGYKKIGDGAFSDRVYLHTQLYVPEGTVWDYIFNTGWGEFHHIKEFASKADDIRNDAVYMIADRSGRNFPVFDKATKSLKNVAYTLNIDDNDTGACWRIVKDGSDTYLYNIGAGMYAAYDVENKLSLSIAPSAVDIKVTKEGTMINGKPAMLVVNKSVTPEPTFILGDANGNGEVEIGDVTSVLTLMATPEAIGYNNKAADANENGEIEIGDVTTILTIMANGE